MNYQFRKRPVVIQAFQMTEERRNDNQAWPAWLHLAWNTPGLDSVFIDSDDPQRQRLCVGTEEGVTRVAWNDWIIQGVDGEIYCCKPSVFEATYEPIAIVHAPLVTGIFVTGTCEGDDSDIDEEIAI